MKSTLSLNLSISKLTSFSPRLRATWFLSTRGEGAPGTRRTHSHSQRNGCTGTRRTHGHSQRRVCTGTCEAHSQRRGCTGTRMAHSQRRGCTGTRMAHSQRRVCTGTQPRLVELHRGHVVGTHGGVLVAAGVVKKRLHADAADLAIVGQKLQQRVHCLLPGHGLKVDSLGARG